MLKTFRKEFVVVAGLLAAPVAVGLAQPQEPVAPSRNDPRIHVLENFFARHRAPARAFAREFLLASDKNGLDWRLLPSISFIETGGGKIARNNNMFGWNSGRHRFKSVRESIHTVADKLAHSKLYRNKGTDQILSTYNTRPSWGNRIRAIMQTLGSPDLTPATVASLN